MKKLLSLLIAFAALFALLSGCAPSDPAADVDFSALTCTQVEENAYAVRFRISHYEDESSRAYSRIEIFDAEGEKNSDWLLLPEGVEGVSGMPQGMVALTVRERSALFVSSASAMSLFAAMDALDCVPLTTADTTWYIDEVKEAIAAGTLVEANRYDSPNYELIAAERAKSGMTLAVYSTMIDYKPEVESMLNSLGLYVLRDQSSAETHPLGRTEWCKVFGELTGRRVAADALFAGQKEVLERTLASLPETEQKPKVLVFYSTTEGVYNVRNAEDYVTKLVSLAGGVQPETVGEGKTGNTKMNEEAFRLLCEEADFLLYNWTSGAAAGSEESVDALISQGRVGAWIKNVPAYKSGNVWRTSDNFYQSMAAMGEMVADVAAMLGGQTEGLTYVSRLA